MLPAAARLVESEQFAAVVRRGRKAGCRRLVMYMLTTSEACGVRVGFVVSKAVGNSVVRHGVSRRLRHIMRERLGEFPDGHMVVVRALPAARDAASPALAADVDKAIRRLAPASPWSGGVLDDAGR